METYKGVLDRIEDGRHAVILIEEINKQFVIDISELPEQSSEGTWFTLKLENDEIKEITINQEETTHREDLIRNKLERLRSRKGSKFKSN